MNSSSSIRVIVWLSNAKACSTGRIVPTGSIKQAVMTQSPVALILSPLVTGGKVFQS